MTEAIRGFWVASATPLAADGSVDAAKLITHAKNLFSKGVDGVVLFGTTGEGTSFNVTERVATIEAVLKAGVPAERIGIGGGFPAISDSIALTRAVLGLGLRHVLILPPYFDRSVTAEGIEDAFAAIIDSVADDRLRAYLYHIPQISGVAIPTSVAANLRKLIHRKVCRDEARRIFERSFEELLGFNEIVFLHQQRGDAEVRLPKIRFQVNDVAVGGERFISAAGLAQRNGKIIA